MLKRLLAASPVSLDALHRPMPQAATSGGSTSSPVWTEAPERRPEPVLLTIGEVAVRLRMSKKSVQRRIKSGVIRTAPTGGRLVRISSDELLRLATGPPL